MGLKKFLHKKIASALNIQIMKKKTSEGGNLPKGNFNPLTRTGSN